MSERDRKSCKECGAAILQNAEICPSCGVRQFNYKGKNKIAAALLAFFLGSFGVHKFYLGKTGWGLVYLLFCWTFIPGFVAFIESVLLLFMSDTRFDEKYNSN
jgi:TM2 domain-containing membrane protein YozV